jgi:DNA-binding response OmpR family regulator
MPRVLFINTEMHIYSVLKRKFELEGFEVVSCTTVTYEALELARHEPDLIVLGQAHAAQNLQQALPNVPIILITNMADEPEPITEVAQLKMPFRPSDLMAMARKVVPAA